MPDNNDLLDFHKSLTKEIKGLQNRVRDLIRHPFPQNTNWGEDGRYKEAILRDVIKKNITSKYKVGTGFIVEEDVISTQIDILIIDRENPPLFERDDFIITTRINVKAIIEVKTDLALSDRQVIEKATRNGVLLKRGIMPFNGIFSFEEPTENIDNKSFRESLQKSKGSVNYISLGKDLFIKYWDRSPIATESIKNFYRIYEIEDISFSYFLSNLIGYLYPNLEVERDWFLYPISGTKEIYKIYDIKIEEKL